MTRSISSKGVGGLDFVVMPQRRVTLLRTDKDIHFTESIAKNGSEQEDISGLVADKVVISQITVQARQALHFRLLFFSRSTFTSTDLDEDTFIGAVDLDLTKYGRATEQ